MPFLIITPPSPWLHRASNAQPAARPGHPWPGLAGSGAVVAGPRGENPRGFLAAYPCTAGCPGGRCCIRKVGQVQCDAASLAACSRCAFAKSASVLHLRQCHWRGPWPQASGQNLFCWWAGGASKTFLYECLLSRVRSTSDIALSMASSGIATLLLEGGCIAHSCFKIFVASLCRSSAYYIPLNNP